jgi:hypothetical protein
VAEAADGEVVERGEKNRNAMRARGQKKEEVYWAHPNKLLLSPGGRRHAWRL